MAIEKEIRIDLTEAQKSLEKFGGTLEDVYSEGAQPLNFAIGELEDRLYELASQGKQNTQEFKDMSAEVGRMKKVIIDTDLVIDGMAQTMAQNVGGAISGITSAFTLAQGAMASFGVESEQIEETLLRVQSALAISEGFQGIREAVPSFKALSNSVKTFGANAISAFQGASNASKAFMLTGIGAIIGGIGLLISNWDKLTEAIGFQTKAQQTSNAVSKQAIENIAAELSAADKLSKTLNDETLTREEKVKAVKDLQAEYPDLLANVDAEKDSLSKINKALELNTQLLKLNAQVKALQELRSEEYKKVLQAETDAQTGANEGLINSIQAWSFGIDAKEFATKKSRAAQREAQKEINVYDDLEKSLNKQIEALKERGAVDEQEAGKIRERQEKARDAYKEHLAEMARQREEARKAELEAELARQEILDEIAEAEYEATTTAVDREINAIQDKYFRLIELARQYGQDTTILEEEQAKQIQAVRDRIAKEEGDKAKANQQEIADAMLAIKQKQLKDEEEAAKKKQEREAQIVSGGFQFLSDIATVFAQGNERQQKIAFNITKAANIAQATMDTYKAAQGAYASFASIPVVGVPLGIAAAGAAVAAGIANINAIRNTQFEGGGGGVSASSSSAPSVSGGFPAQFNVVGNTGVNQLAQTLGDQPLKAYVVAGDVTTAQSLERNKIEQSTI